MWIQSRRLWTLNWALFLGSLLLFGTALYAGRNEIMGEVRIYGVSKVENGAGVWIDGLYVGYVKELKGSKKVFLMPGEHDLIFRQTGYKDVTTKVILGPGEKLNLALWMEKDPQARYSSEFAELKMSVNPKRAAVFVDDRYVGHVAEFDGIGRGMLLNPGKHRVKITLPGYQTFETEVNLLANQKFEIKTDLFLGSVMQANPLVRE